MRKKKTGKSAPPRKSRKSTDAEMTRRVNEVYRQLIQRKTRPEILQYSAETWQVNTRQAENYIAKATALIKQQSAYDRDEELVMAVELMKHVIRKSLNVMDYQRTISAQREINSLLGLNAPVKSETKGEFILKSYAQFTPDDWDKPETED
jgi:hypothetical protein